MMTSMLMRRHEVLFPTTDELEEDIGPMPNKEERMVNDEFILKSFSDLDSDDDSDEDSDDGPELEDELNYLNNDPVRKYQFTYWIWLC